MIFFFFVSAFRFRAAPGSRVILDPACAPKPASRSSSKCLPQSVHALIVSSRRLSFILLFHSSQLLSSLSLCCCRPGLSSPTCCLHHCHSYQLPEHHRCCMARRGYNVNPAASVASADGTSTLCAMVSFFLFIRKKQCSYIGPKSLYRS